MRISRLRYGGAEDIQTADVLLLAGDAAEAVV
jgi:hypothetical protein